MKPVSIPSVGLLGLMVVSLSLAGCIADASKYTEAPTFKDLQVRYTQTDLIMAFAPGSAVLSITEAARLTQFLNRVGIDEGDRISLGVDPAAGALADARLQVVAAYLRGQGIVATSGAVPPKTMPVGQVVVDVGRYVVTTPPCPDWSRVSGPEFTNMPSSNFGCATTTNLGLMVADPGDLVAGRGHGAFDGGPASLAIQRYRTDKVTPLSISSDLPLAATGQPAPAAAAPPAAAASGAAAQ